MTQMFFTKPNCKFCAAARRVSDALSYAPRLESTQAVYKWGLNSYLTIDKHPVTADVIPYFLYIPYHHYNSFLQMPMDLAAEVEEMLEFARVCVLSDPKTAPVAVNFADFEHGEMGEREDAYKRKSIPHAHFHRMFGQFDSERLLAYALEEMNRVGVSFQTVPNGIPYLELLRRYVPSGHNYLYFAVNDVKIVALDNGSDQIYSQFFRQIFARSCGYDFINWKTADESQDEMFRQRLYRSLPRNPEPWTGIPDWVPGKEAKVV